MRPAAAERQIVIDPSYEGMPGIAHGGYVAGLMTAALATASTRVRLRRPAPTGDELLLASTGPGEVELRDGARLLADAVAAELPLALPRSVTLEEARAASTRFPGFVHHPFDGCVCCGPDHPAGLGIFPGPVSGRRLVAAHWIPAAEHADAYGEVQPELVSAALDCPQLWALMLQAPATCPDRVVTAMLETRLEGPVVAGEPHVVLAWSLGRDARGWRAGAAIFGPDGAVRAFGRQTAAIVSGWGVPLGRDAWAVETPVAAA